MTLFPAIPDDSVSRYSLFTYLKGATDEELWWCLPQVEVGRLEDVPAGPHEHHGQSHPIRGFVPAGMRQYYIISSSAKHLDI